MIIKKIRGIAHKRNYRVFERAGEFAIHEVFYDGEGKITGWTETPVFPRAESLEDLVLELERYAEALRRPVVDAIQRRESTP